MRLANWLKDLAAGVCGAGMRGSRKARRQRHMNELLAQFSTQTQCEVLEDRALLSVSQLGAAASQFAISNTLSSFTVGAGTDRVLIVAVGDPASTDVSNVTFNGSNLTQSTEIDNSGIATDEIWYLALGSSGSSTTGNIVITSSGTLQRFIGAVAYQSVDQTTPVVAGPKAESNGSNLSSSLDVTSETGDLVFDHFDGYLNGSSVTTFAGSGQTAVHTQTGAITDGISGNASYTTTTKPGASSVTMSRTSNAIAMIHLTVNINGTVVSSGTGTAQFTTSTKSATETGGTQSVSVSLTGTGTLAGSVTVPIIATNGTAGGSDYSLTTTSVTFDAGTDLSTNPTKTVSFSVTNDTLLEGSEGFSLSLGTITAASDTITKGSTTSNSVTISDDESATLSIESTSSVTEAGGAQSVGKVTLSVTGSGTGTFGLGSGLTLTADVTDAGTGNATSGTDFSAVGTQTVTFSGGATTGDTRSVSLNVTSDSLLEVNETINLSLGNLTGGASVSKSLGTTSNTTTISDDESATLSIESTSSVTEAGGAQGVGVVTLTITGTGSGTFALGTGISITADITDSMMGSATSGTDYSSFGTQTVTFNSAESTGATDSAVLTVTDDSDIEGSETVDLTLSNLGGSPVSVSLGTTTNTTTISDNDSPVPTVTISLSDTSLKIGDTSNATFTFNTPVTGFTNDDITVGNATLSTVSSSDGGTTWSAVLTPDFNIEDATNVVTVDKSGVFNSSMVAGSGTSNSSNYKIDTKRPTVSIDVADTALRSGETSLVTFTFDEAVTGFTTADLFASNSTLSALSSSDGGVTWTATLTPSSNLEDTSNLVTVDNTGVTDLAGNFGSGLTDSNNFSIDTKVPTADITDISPDPRTTNAGVVSITFSEDVTGVDIADFTLTRDMKSVDISGLSVSGSGSAYTLDLSTVSKAVGNYVLTLNATGSSIVDGASNDLAGDASDSWDRVVPTVDLSVDSTSINEGKTATVTATLSAATDDDVTINVTIGGTANGKNDYTLSTTPLTIAAGQTTATLTINASDDTLDEPSETVTVTLGSLTNASSGTNSSVDVTIVDTDSAPITAVATNGVLVVTVVQAVPTDSRVTYDSKAMQFVVGSYTEGVLATTFLIEAADVTNGLQGVLGTEADYFDASGIALTTSVQAGNGNDTILGSSGTDSVDGGDGNDLMLLGAGADSANGGAGDDVIRGGAGVDVLAGGDGADSLYGQGAVDTLNGGAGVDLLDGGVAGVAIIDDFAGALVVTNTGYSTASGKVVAESIGYLNLTGSGGADSIDLTSFTFGLADISTGDGNDILTGSSVKDFLQGDGGNDLITGGGGDDNLQGGLGADTINGGDGNDTGVGGGGDDVINGDAGDDILRGNSGNDTFNGGAGNDSLYGTDGDDFLQGGTGDDRLDGEVGNDRAYEQADADFEVNGTSFSSSVTGTDTGRNIESIALAGGASANKLDARFATIPVNLLGDAGNDTLLGGSSNDTIRGAAGNDVMSGGGGDDNIAGGAGIDVLTERLNVDATITGVTIMASGLGTDTIATVEGVVLIGLGAANNFNASASTVAVTLLGGNGNDTLIGSSKADVLIGGNRANPAAGTDSITGSAGVDILDNDTADVHVGTGDSVVADVFASLPSWIDAL